MIKTWRVKKDIFPETQVEIGCTEKIGITEL